MQIKILFAIPALALLMTGAAAARCIALPDGPQSRNVENAERRMVCLNDELAQTGRQIELKARIDRFSTQIQRMELQNRFDRLPTAPQF
jgi:hypothetical protein